LRSKHLFGWYINRTWGDSSLHQEISQSSNQTVCVPEIKEAVKYQRAVEILEYFFMFYHIRPHICEFRETLGSNRVSRAPPTV
jgi:hypothetical protein